MKTRRGGGGGGEGGCIEVCPRILPHNYVLYCENKVFIAVNCGGSYVARTLS